MAGIHEFAVIENGEKVRYRIEGKVVIESLFPPVPQPEWTFYRNDQESAKFG
jgi:hypothetical protein